MKKQSEVAGAHYDTMSSEGTPLEAIDIIESVVKRTTIPRDAAYNIGQALKYILRVGVKHPDAWKEDMQKAENYLHRATTGEWMPSIKPKKK